MAVEMQIGRISSHLAPLSTGDVEQLSGDAFYEAYNSIFIIQRAGGRVGVDVIASVLVHGAFPGSPRMLV